jgi:hypothetical protein
MLASGSLPGEAEGSRARAYSRLDTAGYLAVMALSSAVLMIARRVPPSVRGFGTHEQLGLPPCFFLKLTGWPCPGCGLTTCFAHAAKLHFAEAFLTQPFGLLAFFLLVAFIPLAAYFISRRIPWPRVLDARAMEKGAQALFALALLSWVYKIAVMW